MKTFLSALFIVLVVLLLGVYWFIPNQELEFFFAEKNSNFSIGNTTEVTQFYENMRFPESEISYTIEDCTLQKESEMERAFKIVENLTILNFYPNLEGEIEITCDSNTKLEGGLYIAGEGGPSEIIQAGDFNVIRGGKILLIRESKCDRPIVPIHELFHVLGFNHSENENNIMYPVSKCSQTIGDDMLDFINEIYSIQSYPDLVFENASASRSGVQLDVNVSIKNNGLRSVGESRLIVYADDSEIKTFDVEELGIGEGRKIILTNIFTLKRSMNQIKLEIEYSGTELSKENNVAILEIRG